MVTSTIKHASLLGCILPSEFISIQGGSQKHVLLLHIKLEPKIIKHQSYLTNSVRP